MQRLFCWIFGHSWQYYGVGKRKCFRCKIYQTLLFKNYSREGAKVAYWKRTK